MVLLRLEYRFFSFNVNVFLIILGDLIFRGEI